jgi:hypothetical protein
MAQGGARVALLQRDVGAATVGWGANPNTAMPINMAMLGFTGSCRFLARQLAQHILQDAAMPEKLTLLRRK